MGVNMEGLTEFDKECVLMYAKCDMSTVSAGKSLFIHPNTLVYHLKQVHKKTGLNPRKFFDLVKLMDLLGGENYVD